MSCNQVPPCLSDLNRQYLPFEWRWAGDNSGDETEAEYPVDTGDGTISVIHEGCQSQAASGNWTQLKSILYFLSKLLIKSLNFALT